MLIIATVLLQGCVKSLHCDTLLCIVTMLLQAVYTALKETESRATDVVPLWKVPALAPLIPRQRKALQAVSLIRQTTEELIAKCKEMVDAEEQVRVVNNNTYITILT